jgi:hypothetical protein
MSRTGLFLCVESSCNDSAFSFDYERPISIATADEKIAQEIVNIITSSENKDVSVKKIQSSKVGASIVLENIFGVKFEYRLSITRMMPVSESDLNVLFVTSIW